MMRVVAVLTLCLYVTFASTTPPVTLRMSKLLLGGVKDTPTLSLLPYLDGRPWPSVVPYTVSANGDVLHSSNFSTWDAATNSPALSVDLDDVEISKLGFHKLYFALDTSESTGTWIHLRQKVHVIPGFLSLTPPIVTIILAVWLKQVFNALFVGIWLGATYVYALDPLIGLLRAFDTYFTDVINYQSGHAQVIVFCFLLGGLIGIVQRAGGAHGLGNVATRFTTTAARGTAVAVVLSFAVFFDDYTSILVVGTTFAEIIKTLGISRQKMAFIIHAIGTCWASMMPISSWVGVEIGYIQGQPSLANIQDPFVWCVTSIPHRLFPMLLLLFVIIMVATQRDFGEMLAAEQAARQAARRHSKVGVDGGDVGAAAVAAVSATLGDDDASDYEPLTDVDEAVMVIRKRSHSDANNVNLAFAADAPATEMVASEDAVAAPADPLAPDPDCPQRWYNAAVPFVTVALGTLLGMILDGLYKVREFNADADPADRQAESVVNIFKSADSFAALTWGSEFGCIVAIVMVMYQGIFNIREAMEAWVTGVKFNILEPALILLLAWALGQVIVDVHAAQYLANGLGSNLPTTILPFVVSLLCFFMSFATGTAFGSMGVVFPLVIPLADKLSGGDKDVLMQCVGSIMGGSMFGNVVSPIADDTILSAMATNLPVELHVSSMFGYVGLVGVVSLVFGSLPVGMGWYPAPVALLVGSLVLLGVLLTFGERTGNLVETRHPRPRWGWNARFFWGTDMSRRMCQCRCSRALVTWCRLRGRPGLKDAQEALLGHDKQASGGSAVRINSSGGGGGGESKAL